MHVFTSANIHNRPVLKIIFYHKRSSLTHEPNELIVLYYIAKKTSKKYLKLSKITQIFKVKN